MSCKWGKENPLTPSAYKRSSPVFRKEGKTCCCRLLRIKYSGVEEDMVGLLWFLAGVALPVSLCVCPQVPAVRWDHGIPAWAWQRWKDLSLGGPQSCKSWARPPGQPPHRSGGNAWGAGWLLVGQLRGTKQDVGRHGWQRRNWAVSRWHFSPCHLAKSCQADAQASGAVQCCALLVPCALTGTA